MRRMFNLLIILVLIYLAIQFGFRFIEKGYTINYQVETDNNTFDIKEIYTVDKEKDNSYYLEISINGSTFDYQTYSSFNMASKIVKDVYYINNDYECILPIFVKSGVVTDIICKKDNNYYWYNDIKGNTEIDAFAKKMEQYGYNNINYSDNLGELTNIDNITIYDNLINNHFLALENYKGIYTINQVKKLNNISIFENDVYSKSISGFISKYYVVADYSKDTKFNVFNIVNIRTNKKYTISYDYDISLDSYILGSDDDYIYIMDKSTLKEYELDVKHETITEVGNKEKGIKIYKNGNYEYENAYSVVNNNYTFDTFKDNNFSGITYSKVIKTGENIGYYYIFEYNGSTYNVYKSNVQNGVNKIYLFQTTSLTDIVFDKDSIYYKYNEYIKRYNDSSGNKTIIKFDELKFNNNIKLGLYTK